MKLTYFLTNLRFRSLLHTDKRSTTATDPVAVQRDASDVKRKGHRSIVE